MTQVPTLLFYVMVMCSTLFVAVAVCCLFDVATNWWTWWTYNYDHRGKELNGLQSKWLDTAVDVKKLKNDVACILDVDRIRWGARDASGTIRMLEEGVDNSKGLQDHIKRLWVAMREAESNRNNDNVKELIKNMRDTLREVEPKRKADMRIRRKKK